MLTAFKLSGKVTCRGDFIAESDPFAPIESHYRRPRQRSTTTSPTTIHTTDQNLSTTTLPSHLYRTRCSEESSPPRPRRPAAPSHPQPARPPAPLPAPPRPQSSRPSASDPTTRRSWTTTTTRAMSAAWARATATSAPVSSAPRLAAMS